MSKRIVAALFSYGLILTMPGLAHASDYDGRDRDGGYSYRHHRGEDNGNDGDCQSGGCGNRSSRCRGSSGDCRSSFSPGPFDHSPVIVWFCPQQNSCNGQGDGQEGQPPKRSDGPGSPSLLRA